MSDALPISVSILDKDYKISCPTGEQPALLASAKYLDGKMREVRDNGNMMGTERVAVIAALNITNDFLSSNQVQQELGKELPPRLKNLEEKITQALEHARQLEIGILLFAICTYSDYILTTVFVSNRHNP